MSVQRYFTGKKVSDVAGSLPNVRIGQSSEFAAKSPYHIKSIVGNPPSGIYWYTNPGYNSGGTFQAYTDFSIGNGYIITSGLNRTDASLTDWNYFGTAGLAYTGTMGFRNDFYIPAAPILSSWSGDTSNSFILGQTTQNGTNISESTNKTWFVLNVTPAVAKNMFDDAPGTGAFTGSVKASSTGTTGSYYWTTSHGNSIYQMTGSSDTVNSNLWMETRVGGTDTNHTPVVWGSSTGTYYAGNAPFTARWMFMGFSPNNV